MQLTAITTYPVKSCRGHEHRSALVDRCGLAGDRRWMVVDPDGDPVTAREVPALLLVVPERHADGGLTLRAPQRDEISVGVPHDSTPVDLGRSRVDLGVADEAVNAWLGEVVGSPVRLVYMSHPAQRRPNPAFSRPDDRVSLADGYPLLLTTEASLAALNDLVVEATGDARDPLPMRRFRPNLVVDGQAPWAEDGWRRLRVGEAVFRAVKGCDRCVMTTIDPDTLAKGKEPLATLARHRRWDGATWFGMNLVPDTPGATVRLGDEVEVLEDVPAPDGPPR